MVIIIKTYKSESMIEPKEWDLASSETLTYHNYNIEQIEKENIGTKILIYTYDVDEYSKQEYFDYITQRYNEKIILIEQNITDKDLQLVEQGQQITELDLRLLTLEADDG